MEKLVRDHVTQDHDTLFTKLISNYLDESRHRYRRTKEKGGEPKLSPLKFNTVSGLVCSVTGNREVDRRAPLVFQRAAAGGGLLNIESPDRISPYRDIDLAAA